nr:MAG TPA: hypothetical protein [Caudoviricetes sp.]
MGLSNRYAWVEVPGGMAPTRGQAALWAYGPEVSRAIQECGIIELLAHADSGGPRHWPKAARSVDVALVGYPTWDEWGRPTPETSEWRTMTLIRVRETDSLGGDYECVRLYRADGVTDQLTAQKVADVFALEIGALGNESATLEG